MSAYASSIFGEKSVSVLVVQMGRMGSTLQSLMALRAAKQLYPQLEIHFLVKEQHADAVKKVPWVKSVIELPVHQLLGPALEEGGSAESSLPASAQWLGPLVKDRWDFVLNWSFTTSSSYLTALIPGRVKLGYTRRSDMSLSSMDGWSYYMNGVAQGGLDQDIHFIDILTTQLLTALQIHVGDPVDPGDSAVSSKRFFNLKMDLIEEIRELQSLSHKWLGIQLSSRRKKSRWSPENWAELIEEISARYPEYRIMLMGRPEASRDAEHIMNLLNQNEGFRKKSVVSSVGKTNFDTWASIVGRCHWVISSESAVVPLAGVLGTRVIQLTTEGGQLAHSGPYGNGHFVLAKDQVHGIDIQSIDSQAVLSTFEYAIDEKNEQELAEDLEKYDSLDLLKSRIRPVDEGGGVIYSPICTRSISPEEWTSIVNGQIARAWFCGWVSEVGQGMKRDHFDPRLIQKLREYKENGQVFRKICEQAAQTARQLHRKSAKLQSEKIMSVSTRDEIEESNERLNEMVRLLKRISGNTPVFRTFTQMIDVMMHNLKSTQLSDLSEETAEAYELILDGVEVLQNWLDHGLKASKPVPVETGKVISVDFGSRRQREELST